MILKAIMCAVLLYPILLSLRLCGDVWAGRSSSLIAGTLLKFLPKWLANTAVVLFPAIIVALIILIIKMKPI